MHTLRIIPLRTLSSDYWVQDEGRNLALLDLARLRSRGEFTIAGERYTFTASGLLRQTFTMARDGRVEAAATRTQLLPVVYQVRARDRLLEIRAVPPMRRHRLLHGGREIGLIAPEQAFSRRVVAQFREPLPAALEVFLVAVVLLRWRRQARAAGG